MRTYWKFYMTGAAFGIGLTLLAISAITWVYVSPALDMLIEAQPYLEQLSTLASQAQEIRGFVEESMARLENSEVMLDKALATLCPIASILPTGDLVGSLHKVEGEITIATERIQSMESTLDDDTWTLLNSLLADIAALGRTAAFIKQLLMAMSAAGVLLVIGAVSSTVYMHTREGKRPSSVSVNEMQATLSLAPASTSATQEGVNIDSKFCGQCGARILHRESGYCEECGARLV